MEKNIINIIKVEHALKYGTEMQKRELLESIFKVNTIAETIWFQTALPERSTESNIDNVESIEVCCEKKSNHQKNAVPERNTKSNIKPEITLVEIHCDANSTKNYYDQDGFVYTKRKGTANAIYFRCRNKAGENCNASVICRNRDLEKAILSKPHTHEAEIKNKYNLKFCKKIEQLILKDTFKTSLEVYLQAKTALRGEINMIHIRELEKYLVFIHRVRKVDIPLHATTIKQFDELINDPKYKQSYMLDEYDELFFRGVWKGPAGSNVVFMSEKVLAKIKTMKKIKLLMDGTFRCLPNHLEFRQLYIISVVIEERSYPLAYILMEKRDTSSYKLIFNNLKAMIPAVTVSNCMSDYEAATRKAIREVFPEARLSGCFFHYVQAIVKKFKRFGLKDDDKFKIARDQVCALALLPNDLVVTGFKIISKAFKKSIRWERFETYWMKQLAGANISVYGLKDRTNNFAESLNRTLNRINKSPNPHIWLLIRNLRSVNTLRCDELVKVNGGQMSEIKKGSSKMRALNKKILRATTLFDKTGNVKIFLKRMAFNESLEKYFNPRFGSDDHEDDDDEIIPNDYNIKSDFRKKFPRTSCLKRNNRPIDIELVPQRKKKKQ